MKVIRTYEKEDQDKKSSNKNLKSENGTIRSKNILSTGSRGGFKPRKSKLVNDVNKQIKLDLPTNDEDEVIIAVRNNKLK